MHTLNALMLSLIMLTISLSIFGQKSDTDGTIFLGRQHSFVLKEPDNWIIDKKTAEEQGLEAVLYREGSSWKDGVAVMYARLVSKDEAQPTVETVVKDDVTDFMKLSRQSTVADYPPLTTRDKKNAIVKEFYDAANRNHELVAFIDEPKVVVLLVLSARDKAEYEKSLPAFKALVGSYIPFNLSGSYGSQYRFAVASGEYR